ncbi:MAG: glycosyltransferase family 2 protein [Ignavibacteria bacterium]|nr:glycosyltransferase family 2 protein [Ignavibacteria bacterium]
MLDRSSNNKNNKKPIVTIIIPCRNEFNYIEKSVTSILNQKDLTGEIEIIVVDGLSDDGTRERLEKLQLEFPNLKVIDNLKRITPFALNLGIKEAHGEFVCIMGAHSEYAENYLSNSIKLMEKYPEASCVGGPITSEGNTNFGKAVALAMSSSIGVGNAKHRFPEYEGYAEIACFPVFRKEVFSQIGLYDESLVRNQDDEFCSRLTSSGRKVYISPSVKSVYFVKDTPSKLFIQYFYYGLYKPLALNKVKTKIKIRHLVPFIFVIYLLSLPLAFRFSLWLLPIILYFLVIGWNILRSKLNVKSKLYLIIIYPLIHISYGVGFILGMSKLIKDNKFHPAKSKS